MKAFGTTVFIIFFVAAVIGGIYMLIYRRNLNKALRENNGRHINMPEVRSVIIFILVVVLFFTIFRTKYLVEKLQEDMDAQIFWIKRDIIDELEDDIEHLEYQLNEFKNANKLVGYHVLCIDECDLEKGTATYRIEVALNKFSEDTSVSVNICDKNISLSRDLQGKYVGTVEFGLFDYVQESMSILVTQGGITTTEDVGVETVGEPWRSFLPTITAKAPCIWEYSDKKVTLDEKLEIYLESGAMGKFVDAYLEIYLAGDGTKKVDIGFREEQTAYSVSLNEHLPEIYPASILYVYVVGVDELGYTHKALVNSWEESTWYSHEVYKEMMETGENIYDKDGKLLTSGYETPGMSVQKEETCE